MLKGKITKQKYDEMIELCVLEQGLQGDDSFMSRLKSGQYLLDVEKYRADYTQREEEIAREKAREFLLYNVDIDYRFEENRGESYYDLAQSMVRISPRVRKFETLMPQSSLDSIVILEYIRACGYRNFYKGHGCSGGIGYEECCKRVIDLYIEDSTEVIENGDCRIETIIAEDDFRKLLKMDYYAEVSVWRYVAIFLNMQNFEAKDNDKTVCRFIEEEVYKMSEYYLQKKIKDLAIALQSGELQVSNKYLFRYK